MEVRDIWATSTSLIAFYSRTGVTEALAKAIARGRSGKAPRFACAARGSS
jgi:hypothetical protein